MKRISGRLKISINLLLLTLWCFIVQAQNASCPANMDFEMGSFQNWQCFLGGVKLNNDVNVISVQPSSPTDNRHTLLSYANKDEMDEYGNFPVLCPNGSGNSVRLGNSSPNHEAERISYTFTVPSNQHDYSITYQYAVVFEDPQHKPEEQPRFTAKVLDVATNTYVSCASYDYIAKSDIPGFTRSRTKIGVWYKSWTPVTINLTGYEGKTIVLEFTTADCTLGGHFGYAYVDVNSGCTAPVYGAYICSDEKTTTLTGPYGYKYYNWYDNNFTQKLGTQSALTLDQPVAGSSIALEVIPFSGFGCRDTLYTIIQSAVSPKADAGKDVTLCKGNSALIGSPASIGNIYKWLPSAGLNNPVISNPVVKPDSSAKYTLTVTNLLTGCTSSDSIMVILDQPAAFFTFNGMSAQCLTANHFSFHNTNPDSLSYEWSFGDGTRTNEKEPMHQYNAPGTFNVQLKATDPSGCSDSSYLFATIYGLPSGTLYASSDIFCEGHSVVLSATGGNTYNWYRDGTFIPSNQSDTLVTDFSGIYSVEVIDDNGCKNQDSLSVTLHELHKPAPDIEFDKYCSGVPVQFADKEATADNEPLKYLWDFGNGTTSVEKEPKITFAQAGRYNITLSVSSALCTDLTTTTAKELTIEKLIKGISYEPLNAVVNKPLQLNARNQGINYEWQPYYFLDNNKTASPVFIGTREETYEVHIKLVNGCDLTDTQMVRIFKERDIYVPNAFTPNRDGRNDRIHPFLIGIRELKVFRVMNRWGLLLYESKTALPGWDGTFNGALQPMGTYVWEAEAIGEEGKNITRKGTFTLIR